jgi:hypothetical protein
MMNYWEPCGNIKGKKKGKRERVRDLHQIYAAEQN